MAVTVTNVSHALSSATKVFEVEATADADTTATIAHGLAEVPRDVFVTPLLAAARLSLWIVTTIDATNVVLGKATTAGSGGAGAQARVVIGRIHADNR